MRPASNRHRQAGLTLIELMISLVIGLLILGALLVAYLGSRSAYRSNDSLARVQEAGRFSLDFIAQDARMSGFIGCRSRNLTIDDQSTVNITSPAVTFNGSRDGIRGFDGSNTGSIGQWTNPTTIARVGSSDVLTIRRAAGAAVGIALNSDPVARTVTLRHNAIGVQNGDLAVLVNCERAMVFFVTNSPALTGAGNYPTVLEYKASGGGPGGTLGNNTAIPVPPFFTVGSRSEVTRFIEISYFIGVNSAGRPSLFRAASGAVEELVENVEDMDILYGVDTTLPDQDGIIDVYQRADQVTDWGRVASARISLLIVGPEDNVTTAAQTYTFRESTGDGVADVQAAADRRLRHVFTTTISLRNRVL